MTQCDWFSAHTKPLYLLSILWVRPEHGIRVCVSTCVCVCMRVLVPPITRQHAPHTHVEAAFKEVVFIKSRFFAILGSDACHCCWLAECLQEVSVTFSAAVMNGIHAILQANWS